MTIGHNEAVCSFPLYLVLRLKSIALYSPSTCYNVNYWLFLLYDQGIQDASLKRMDVESLLAE